jgi:hypothetical protein
MKEACCWEAQLPSSENIFGECLPGKDEVMNESRIQYPAKRKGALGVYPSKAVFR